jgi:hypothetical protein
MTKTAAVFSSRLAPALKRYVDLKRALGRRFDDATRTLQLLDRFLQDQTIGYPDLNAAAFQAWCQTQEHLASGVPVSEASSKAATLHLLRTGRGQIVASQFGVEARAILTASS